MAGEVDLSSLSGEDLSRLQSDADKELLRRKVQEARAAGRCFATLEEIPQMVKTAHAHRLQPVAHPGDVPSFSCLEAACHQEVYQCGNCGYVPSVPREEPFDNMQCLAGSKGVNYFCRICGDNIGTWVQAQS